MARKLKGQAPWPKAPGLDGAVIKHRKDGSGLGIEYAPIKLTGEQVTDLRCHLSRLERSLESIRRYAQGPPEEWLLCNPRDPMLAEVCGAAWEELSKARRIIGKMSYDEERAVKDLQARILERRKHEQTMRGGA